MNYSGLILNDTINGKGIRTTLFVSGCRHHCKGCFNSSTWDFNSGEPFTNEIQSKIIDSLEPEYVSGLSILGGEPFEPENQEVVLNLIKLVKNKFPNKNIWVWSGYLYEEMINESSFIHTEYTKEILENIDYLIDGEFKFELKNLLLKFKGSSNQRIINVKETLKNNEIILSDLN